MKWICRRYECDVCREEIDACETVEAGNGRNWGTCASCRAKGWRILAPMTDDPDECLLALMVMNVAMPIPRRVERFGPPDFDLKNPGAIDF